MSQKPQLAAGARCPGCAEPVDAGDRFCGACGYDLSAAPAPPDDHATIAMNGEDPSGVSPASGVSGASVEWPQAPEVDSSDVPAPVHLATEVPGIESGGKHLPAAEPTAGGSVGGDYPLPAPPGRPPTVAPPVAPPAPGPLSALAAPAPAPATPAADPRTAAPISAGGTQGGGKQCVFCSVGQVDQDDYCEHCGKAQPRERDHMEQELDAVAAVSDRGLRHHRNEDAFAISSTALPDGSPAVVAIVCDGVSSATRPDEASLAASRAANESLLASLPLGTHPQQAMFDAILAASESVNSLAGEPGTTREHAPHQNAPACTLVGAIVAKDLLIVGWVGDSRAYWVPVDRTAPTARLTEDDSWAAQMVSAGLMNEAEAYADERAHAITGWLGADAYELEPHTASFKPDRPGVVVVCTDGLWNYAESAQEMADALPVDAADRPLHSAQVLVGHALDGGGHDNVTVALLPFPVPAKGAGSA
ncbi:PP2C family serine/threonine-protein phosphatase [Streptomyces sp. NPDC058001]|uniref:PP2C family serine/threonine-protein phosphatase n=1 Tax=Streptomyces sp. NPDC058001 TaxID=3346300 RepID=UPI0036E38AB2